MRKWQKSLLTVAAAAATFFAAACGHSLAPSSSAASASGATANGASGTAAAPVANSPAGSTAANAQITVAPADQAPPASQTGGFDGMKAYDFTAKLVAFGPRPPASDAIHKTQDYIIGQLKSFGCQVDMDDFHSQTPLGDMAMKNIIAKVPGTGQGILLLLTHYDTLRLDGFVGAEDGGSSTGLMLEMARNLCSGPKQPNSVWMAFLDGEEAQVVKNGEAQWTSTDSVYGSRELSASLAVSGDLKRVHAVILVDMIGQKNLEIPREEESTKWLVDLIWSTAARLGYQNVFTNLSNAVDDDHMPFLNRKVAAADIIDLYGYGRQQQGYWHTTQDTMDKLSPRSLAIVGHVMIESVAELQKKFQ